MMKKIGFLTLIMLTVLSVGCEYKENPKQAGPIDIIEDKYGDQRPLPDPSGEEIIYEPLTKTPSNTPAPTATSTPTPEPTGTPVPSTPTPEPTGTPVPSTPTPEPTETPVPTTPTPEPTPVPTGKLYCKYLTSIWTSNSTSDGQLKSCVCGESVTLIEDLGTWSYVECAEGQGYVLSKYWQDQPLIHISDVPIETIPETDHHFSTIIYAGDSRFMEMQQVTNFNNGVYKVNEGYQFLVDNLDRIRNLYKGDDYVIVLEFGVNDLRNIGKYIELANDLSAQGYNIAFMTVMPVNEELEKIWGYDLKNADIDAFNRDLATGLDPKIILLDANGYLKKVGYDMYDGLHFTNYTYEIIYRFINESLM